jgi:hypothetical protein
MRRRFLILIGPTRTGTTSLFRQLARDTHNFCGSRVKETNYFLTEASAASHPEYIRQFKTGSLKDGRILVEASPRYFVGGLTTARAVARTLLGHDVFILATLREPVERFLSLYQHVLTKRSLRKKVPDFERFVDEALAHQSQLDQSSSTHPNYVAFNEGRYSELLESWATMFGHDRVRLVFFESLSRKAERQQTIRLLYQWLRLDPSNVAPDQSNDNKTRFVRSELAHSLALKINDAFEPVLNRYPNVRQLAQRVYYGVNEARDKKIIYPQVTLELLHESYSSLNRTLAITADKMALGETPRWVVEMSGD